MSKINNTEEYTKRELREPPASVSSHPVPVAIEGVEEAAVVSRPSSCLRW